MSLDYYFALLNFLKNQSHYNAMKITFKGNAKQMKQSL